MSSSGWVWWSWLLLTCACSGGEHPDYLPDVGRGGSGGSGSSAGGAKQAGGTDATAGTAGTGNTGSTDDSGGSLFDPSQVYWNGDARLWDDKTFFSATGLASAESPTVPIYGFTLQQGGELWGDKFVYAKPGRIFQFRPDTGKEEVPEKNDPRIKTPPCDERVSAFKTTADGRLFYSCVSPNDVWYEDGAIVHEGGSFIAMSYGNSLLVSSTLWGELGSMETRPIEGLPDDLYLRDVRASGVGFHAVFGPEEGYERELWNIEDAVASKLGDYALPAGLTRNKGTALTPDDTLYWFGADEDDVGAIFTTTIGGDSTIIHVDSVDVPIQLDGQELITIPLITGP